MKKISILEKTEHVPVKNANVAGLIMELRDKVRKLLKDNEILQTQILYLRAQVKRLERGG